MQRNIIIKTAFFDASQTTGSLAVRQLLSSTINTLNQTHTEDWTGCILNEQVFPYRVMPTNWYVSFSHSVKHKTSHGVCALLLSPYASQGVDIELNEISPKIALRHFSTLENQAISNLSQLDAERLRLRLWNLKEAYIKATQGRLMLDLKQCMVQLVGRQILDLSINYYETQAWIIVFSKDLICAIILKEENNL